MQPPDDDFTTHVVFPAIVLVFFALGIVIELVFLYRRFF